MLRKNGTFWEKPGYFWEKSFIYLCILPFTLVFALSFATWTFREKNGTLWETSGYFWEKSGYFWEKSGYYWEKSGYFWETYGSNQNSGRALCEKPVSLASKASTFKSSTKWSSPKCPWWCHKWHTENVEKQDLQEALGQVASGKRFLQESLPIPNFRKCFKKYIFFRKHLLSDFWGMLKTLLI